MCFLRGGTLNVSYIFAGDLGGTLKCNLDPWDVLRMDGFWGGRGGGEK